MRIVELFPRLAARESVLIVQDLPTSHRGAYLYLHGRSLLEALKFIHPDMHPYLNLVVIRTRRNHLGVDLRSLKNASNVFAVQWDAEEQVLVDRTREVRRNLVAIHGRRDLPLEWTGMALSGWSVTGATETLVEEDGMTLELGRRVVVTSPFLPVTTRVVEFELSAMTSAAGEAQPGRVGVNIKWNTGVQGRPGYRRTISLAPDGRPSIVTLPIGMVWFEELEAEHLVVLLTAQGGGHAFRIHSIRAYP